MKRNQPEFFNISSTLVIDTSMEKGLHEYYSMEAQNLEFFSESSKLNLDLFQRAEITLTSSISVLH